MVLSVLLWLLGRGFFLAEKSILVYYYFLFWLTLLCGNEKKGRVKELICGFGGLLLHQDSACDRVHDREPGLFMGWVGITKQGRGQSNSRESWGQGMKETLISFMDLHGN